MQLGGSTEESSYSSSSQNNQSEEQLEKSEITREIISQELKAADEEADRRRRQSSGGNSGIIYRRDKTSPVEEENSTAASAAAAVQLVKDKMIAGSKSFTSELMKLGKVLSPSKEKTPSVSEHNLQSPVRSSNQVIVNYLKIKSATEIIMFFIICIMRRHGTVVS